MPGLNLPVRAALVAACLLLLALVAGSVAEGARADERAPMFFDAGHAAIDDATRDATLQQLDALGVRRAARHARLGERRAATRGHQQAGRRSTRPIPTPTTGAATAG